METQEMRDFFQRVVDHVATLSTQAERVNGLEQQVNDLRNRISSLEQANYDLQQQLGSANARVTTLEQEVDHHRNAATAANEHVNALRETIVQRDNAVYNLTSEVKTEQDSHSITKADLADARRAVQEWEANYNKLKDEHTMTVAAESEWRQRANEAQAKVLELQAKLDRIGSMFQSNVFPFGEQAAS